MTGYPFKTVSDDCSTTVGATVYDGDSSHLRLQIHYMYLDTCDDYEVDHDIIK